MACKKSDSHSNNSSLKKLVLKQVEDENTCFICRASGWGSMGDKNLLLQEATCSKFLNKSRHSIAQGTFIFRCNFDSSKPPSLGFRRRSYKTPDDKARWSLFLEIKGFGTFFFWTFFFFIFCGISLTLIFLSHGKDFHKEILVMSAFTTWMQLG